MVQPRVVILPGNGCTSNDNWYKSFQRDLQATGRFSDVVLRDMPDRDVARERYWMPFILDEMGIDEHTIVVGHSSGALAAMRLAEKHRLLGIVLVAACHTPMGIQNEIASGWYNRPWEWAKMKENTGFILQLHSLDDRFIPIAEADHVASSLGSEYTKYHNRDHFFSHADVRELPAMILAKLDA